MRSTLKRRLEKLEAKRMPKGIWISAAESQAIFEKLCSKLHIEPPDRVYHGCWLSRKTEAEKQSVLESARQKIWKRCKALGVDVDESWPLSVWVDAMRSRGAVGRTGIRS